MYGGQVLVDSTGLGDVVLSQLADIGADGYNFGSGGGKAKIELLTNLQLMHERREVAYPYFEQICSSNELWSNIQELREATWSDNNTCDFLMALALACWIAGASDRADTTRLVQPRTGKL
jgi:hypothetical protein